MHFTTALNMVAEEKSAMASSTSCEAGFKGVLLAGRRIFSVGPAPAARDYIYTHVGHQPEPPQSTRHQA